MVGNMKTLLSTNLVQSIIDRIQQASPQQLPQIGKAIYNLQVGKAKARCDLSNYWSTIWSAYHRQKARLIA